MNDIVVSTIMQLIMVASLFVAGVVGYLIGRGRFREDHDNRKLLRRLVDICYGEFTEQPGSVPSTKWADELISRLWSKS